MRRSLEDGGAPAGLVYIDSHQIASVNGHVNSVSFYVDQSCALATIEFGAFNLINRNLEMNEAELVLTHRSGPLKLGSAAELKTYMNLITIQLCNPGTTYTANGGACKGTKFPIALHQYLGVRSDKCRLGFAPTPTNPLHATTWVSKNRDCTNLYSIIIYFRNPEFKQIRLLNHIKRLNIYQVIILFFIQ